MRVEVIERGEYPHPFVAFLCAPCYHCAEPACIPACPVGAISKRKEDGIVVVDTDICLGKDECQLCLDTCPYDAPQFGAEDNAKMQKCDFCLERWKEEKLPVCVAGCPMRALDAGPIDEMRAKYGEAHEAEGLKYDEGLRPSVVCKPRRQVSLTNY
jgi:anaerobic dimethyl sulfoxide reductase subunit B (iron-sulfur subunit)